jgi:hypothetical protein
MSASFVRFGCVARSTVMLGLTVFARVEDTSLAG